MRDVRENTAIAEQQEDSYDSEWSRESNVVHLLGEQGANQFREPKFSPKMNDEAAWLPTEAMLKFLGKYFNQSLTEGWQNAILTDFPTPECSAHQAPKLDSEMKNQLHKNGKNP